MGARKLKAILFATSAFAFGWTGVARAEEAKDEKAGGLDEIIVMAQKREDTLQNVPVVVTAIPALQIQRMQIVSTTDLAKVVPGLVANNSLGLVAMEASIRGIGALAGNPGIDSSVSLNLDGLSVGSGLALASGLFDLQQIEVLKGPQSLFFGKSTTGGVISLRSADPTDQLELIARASYEIESRERRGELIASGPLTKTLKLRLAGTYSKADGFYHLVGVAQNIVIPPPVNISLPTGGLTPPFDRGPRVRDYATRATLLWQPSDAFDAKLKVNFSGNRSEFNQVYQLISCPEGTASSLGIPFIGSGDNCKLDRDINLVGMDPAYFPGIANGGVPFTDARQKYGTLELHYRPSDTLTLTSVTGFYKLTAESLISVAASSGAGSPVAVDTPLQARQNFSEELRLASNFAGPLNFVLGGLYEDSSIHGINVTRGNTALGLPGFLGSDESIVDTKAYSVFGQLSYDITPELELSGGLRYTDEKKDLHEYDLSSGVRVPVTLITSSIHSKNVSPEVTLSYRPNEDLTVFGSYKIAYKSGGFAVGFAAPPDLDVAFGDEKVKGGEIGIKSRMMDRQLAVNLAGYHYDYTGLQVAYNQFSSVAGRYLPLVANAGKARSYGLDLEIAFRPRSIDGLSLHGAVNWNHGRYLELKNIPCFGGQTIAMGCNGGFDPNANPDPLTGVPTGGFSTQDASGTQLIRGAEWQGNVGLDYEMPIGDFKLGFTSSLLFSSEYPAYLVAKNSRPNDDIVQRSYAKLDLGLTLTAPQDRWELSLLAKNVTNKLTQSISLGNVQNGAIFGGQITGTNASGPVGIDEALGFGQPGRAIFLRASVKFN